MRLSRWYFLGLLAAALPAHAQNAAACRLEPLETRTVVKVLDGLGLALDDGSEVVLVGALPPSIDALRTNNEWPAAREAHRALELLVLGRSIELKGTEKGRRDRYGRILAHGFVLDGGEQVWVQGALVRAGHARVYALPGLEVCLDDLLALEAQAREEKRGLWSIAAFGVRDAIQTREIARLRGGFAIVEGTVLRAASTRAGLYLNFGDDWRRDFTVLVPKTVLKSVANPVPYEGRRVRVRGWVQQRNGPLIEVSTMDEIELLPVAVRP